jgi:hypothetical protein
MYAADAHLLALSVNCHGLRGCRVLFLDDYFLSAVAFAAIYGSLLAKMISWR